MRVVAVAFGVAVGGAGWVAALAASVARSERGVAAAALALVTRLLVGG